MQPHAAENWRDNDKSITRKPSWRKGYARQRRHSMMAVSRHLGFYRNSNSAIRSADPKNRCLEPNMERIGCTVCEFGSSFNKAVRSNSSHGNFWSQKLTLQILFSWLPAKLNWQASLIRLTFITWHEEIYRPISLVEIMSSLSLEWMSHKTRRYGDVTHFATKEPTMRFFHLPDGTVCHSARTRRAANIASSIKLTRTGLLAANISRRRRNIASFKQFLLGGSADRGQEGRSSRLKGPRAGSGVLGEGAAIS